MFSKTVGSAIELSREQRAVVEAEGNIVVVAGAGTGKTETLAQRVIHTLALIEDCTLRELVVLTFTDKAAGEMRERIYRGLLQKLMAERDPTARRRWSTLCASFAETHRIETFDAFNHRLLSAHPEFQLAPNNFSPMTDYDERQLQTRLTRALWDWLESLDETDSNRLDFFALLEDFSRRQILDLLALLAAEETQHLTKLAVMPDEIQYRNDLRALAARFALRFEKRQTRQLQRLWSSYRRELEKHFPGLPPLLDNALRNPEQLLPRDSEVVTKGGAFRKKWIHAGCKELCAQIETLVFPLLKLWQSAEEQLFKTLQSFADIDNSWQADWRARNHLARAARLALWWAQKREELCRREGWLDFQSAHLLSLKLLEEHPAVAARLRAGCRFVLVDEFQDTNFAQWRLVSAFASDNNVMLIGDGKQSIYGFRGGDITVFDHVRRDVLQIETPHNLSLSQRATPELTRFFNEVFREYLPDEKDPDRENWEAPFQELHSARKDDDESNVFVISADAANEDEESDDGDEAWSTPDAERSTPEARAPQSDSIYEESDLAAPLIFRAPREIELLADATALLLKEIQDDADAIKTSEDNAPARELLRPEFRKVSERLAKNQPGTIGVLFSTHWAKAVYERALRRAGVRYASVKGIGFFQSQPVYDAINLLHFLFDAHDDLALCGVLRSPLFGASDLALLELKRVRDTRGLASFWSALEAHVADAARDENFLDEDDERALARAQLVLSSWRARAHVENASAILESVERETEVVFARALHGDSSQWQENWRKVLDITREREARGQGSARALAAYFGEQAESEEREAEADLSHGGAIQLMTVFAAKGLGFPMTIVAQMDGGFRFDEALLRKGAIERREEMLYALNWKDGDGNEQKNLVWEILREQERAQRQAEWIRLFHVACTRAADFLLLAMPQAHKSATWAEMAAPFVEEKTRFELGALQRRAVERELAAQAAERSHQTERAQNVFLAPVVNADLLRPLPAQSMGKDASVTTVLALLRESKAAPSTPGVEKASTNLCRAHGVVFHRLLRANVDADHARIRSFVFAKGLPVSRAAILERQLGAARAWLEEQNFEWERARHEVGFSMSAEIARRVLPEIEAQVQWLSGAIDLLVPRGDGWTVVDFKTHGGETSPEKLMAQNDYADQVRLYRAAVEYSRLDARESWVVFLSENGQAQAFRVE